MSPSVASRWQKKAAGFLLPPLPGESCFQGLFLQGASMCLNHILAPWPPPSPTASHQPLSLLGPGRLLDHPLCPHLVQAAALLTGQPLQGCVCLHTESKVGKGGPSTKQTPSTTPHCQDDICTSDLATQTPRELVPASVHLHPAQNPDPELSPTGPKRQLLAYHRAFTHAVPLARNTVLPPLFIFPGHLLQEACLDALDETWGSL